MTAHMLSLPQVKKRGPNLQGSCYTTLSVTAGEEVDVSSQVIVVELQMEIWQKWGKL